MGNNLVKKIAVMVVAGVIVSMIMNKIEESKAKGIER
jgi:hypothetical protein